MYDRGAALLVPMLYVLRLHYGGQARAPCTIAARRVPAELLVKIKQTNGREERRVRPVVHAPTVHTGRTVTAVGVCS